MAKRKQIEMQIIDIDDDDDDAVVKKEEEGEEEQEQEESVTVLNSSTNSSDDLSCSKRWKRRVRTGSSRQPGKLNSDLFSQCFENIWESFSDNVRASFTYLDCLWFSWYMDESYKEKVLLWIKKKNIFSKKYVFVPIVHWGHWNLLIICNFGELSQAETQTTCMLLLDSLHDADPRRFEPPIRKFVKDIYEAEKRPESKKLISQIPLLVPKVPQQRNGEECGSFVLYFISLFMEHAPEIFSINEGYPYFMTESWFTPEDFDRFCKRYNLCTPKP